MSSARLNKLLKKSSSLVPRRLKTPHVAQMQRIAGNPVSPRGKSRIKDLTARLKPCPDTNQSESKLFSSQ
jgi:hypothetical protein